MLATQHSIGNSLRWMRIWLVISLITANLMAVLLADTAAAAQGSQSFFQNAWNQRGVNLFINYNPSIGTDDIGISLSSVESGANTSQVSLAKR
jgi:hypothetical protein